MVLPLLGGAILPLVGLAPPARLLAVSYLLGLLGLLGLVVPLLWQLGGTGDLMALQNDFSKSNGSTGSWLEYLSVVAPLALNVLAVPAGIAVLLAGVSRVRGVPARAGMVRGFQVVALPMLTLILLTYVALTFSTARLEKDTLSHMERCVGLAGVDPALHSDR